MISFYNGKTTIEENTHHLSHPVKEVGFFCKWNSRKAGKQKDE